MKTRYAIDPIRYQRMTTTELRESFLVPDLFQTGQLNLLYCENERAIVGAAVPASDPLPLEAGKEIAADFFCQRREVGVLNVGAAGSVTVAGKTYAMSNRDCLYIGRGSQDVSFSSEDAENPARFYILSYPAHADYPTVQAKQADASPVHIGSALESNERTIYKYIHPEGIKSCQLVMGFTELEPGCIWNTMPCHTHARRTEVYFYFDMTEATSVFHFMGPADETRHLVVRNEEAVLSPLWSIHSGAGTGKYAFIWGMGGENQRFDDMDHIGIQDLQ